MPAMVSRGVGSFEMSDAEGTTVWPFFSKKSSQRRWISADSMRFQPSQESGASGQLPGAARLVRGVGVGQVGWVAVREQAAACRPALDSSRLLGETVTLR